jgi:hypothetical protein
MLCGLLSIQCSNPKALAPVGGQGNHPLDPNAGASGETPAGGEQRRGQGADETSPSGDSDAGPSSGAAPAEGAEVKRSALLLGDLPKGEAQRQALCARSGKDKVREVFCGPNPPKVQSLKDLQKALGLDIDAGNGGLFGNIFGGVGFVFNAASSSLVAQSTSSINPRLIMFTRGNSERLVSLGFVRGEQFAEIAARDPDTGVVNFFLVEFRQDCNERTEGCRVGELLTPAIEKDWREVTIYEDKDIENTIVDCLQCHQPEGPSGRKMLRMQERVNPWLHFMRSSTAGGQQLLADFRAAKGDEEYAGIPAARFGQSDPAQLQAFVEGAGFANQPNEFSSIAIPGRGANAAWTRLYDGFVQGRFIAPPYHNLRISSPEKLSDMTAHYQAYRRGEVKAEDLRDIREVIDDGGKRDMGFMVKEGLSGQDILVQACAQCHHDSLNQDISRAKFKLDPNKMDCKERELAIERLRLPAEDHKRMPPARFRSLTQDEIEKVVAVLRCSEEVSAALH